jgi:hypothetical protein
MKIYTVCRKATNDLSSLPSGAELRYLFSSVNTHYNDYAWAYDIIDRTFETMKEEDRLILNGPAWAMAIVSYLWLTNTERKTYGILQYDVRQKCYVEMKGEIPGA